MERFEKISNADEITVPPEESRNKVDQGSSLYNRKVTKTSPTEVVCNFIPFEL